MSAVPERLFDEPSAAMTSLSLLTPAERAIELCDTLLRTCTSLDRMIERVSAIVSPSCSKNGNGSTSYSQSG